MIPTRVARNLGLGEAVVVNNAGYLLQGRDLIERPVYRRVLNQCGEARVTPTTLQEVLHNEVQDEEWWVSEVYWMNLEWRHIQMVVDEHGGQRERFLLLANILHHIADVHLMDGMEPASWGMMDDIL